MKPAVNLRALATEILLAVLVKKEFLSKVLANKLATLQLNSLDQALVQAMCYGVLRHYYRLQTLATAFIEKPLKDKDLDVQLLILIGLYQLTEMRIPTHAAVDETVSAAKTLGKVWAKGLINAILRNFLRKPTSLPNIAESHYEHPEWLVGKLKKYYPEQWLDIIDNNLIAPPMHIRVNRQKVSRAEYLVLLQNAGLKSEISSLSPDGITLHHPVDVKILPRFNEGWVSIQDLAAQMAAILLEASPGETILDACAAPGGKTAHILETSPTADLTALDIDEKRLARIADNLQRIGLTAKLSCSDAANLNSWWDQCLFDRILLDAPCSATGVIRRHPDIRLLRTPAEIQHACMQQKILLDNLWPSLSVGGTLLYATCSILPEENDKQIASFLAEHPDAKTIAINLPSGLKTAYGWQFLPTELGPDGFYYAKLQKT